MDQTVTSPDLFGKVWSFLGNSEKGDSSSSEDVEDESEEIDDDLTPPLLD